MSDYGPWQYYNTAPYWPEPQAANFPYANSRHRLQTPSQYIHRTQSNYPTQYHPQMESISGHPTRYTNPNNTNHQARAQSSLLRKEKKQSPQYLCLHNPCAENLVGFARKADLQRHVSIKHHRDVLSLTDCEFPHCHRTGSRGFTRKDKMIEHMREVHKVPIPKRISTSSSSSSSSPSSSYGKGSPGVEMERELSFDEFLDFSSGASDVDDF